MVAHRYNLIGVSTARYMVEDNGDISTKPHDVQVT